MKEPSKVKVQFLRTHQRGFDKGSDRAWGEFNAEDLESEFTLNISVDLAAELVTRFGKTFWILVRDQTLVDIGAEVEE